MAGVSNLIEDSAYRNRVFVFKDRLHAGELLADKLRPVVANGNAQVLAIPAGGVPVGYVLTEKLKIPFDVVVVRKIQIPWNTEAGFGAVTWDGTPILNDPLDYEEAEYAAYCAPGVSEVENKLAVTG